MIRRTLSVLALVSLALLALAAHTVPAPLTELHRAAPPDPRLMERQNLQRAILSGTANHGQLKLLASRHAVVQADYRVMRPAAGHLAAKAAVRYSAWAYPAQQKERAGALLAQL